MRQPQLPAGVGRQRSGARPVRAPRLLASPHLPLSHRARCPESEVRVALLTQARSRHSPAVRHAGANQSEVARHLLRRPAQGAGVLADRGTAAEEPRVADARRRHHPPRPGRHLARHRDHRRHPEAQRIGGGVWGLLLGTIFGGPIGAIVGGAAMAGGGALYAKLVDTGIKDATIAQLRNAVPRGVPAWRCSSATCQWPTSSASWPGSRVPRSSRPTCRRPRSRRFRRRSARRTEHRSLTLTCRRMRPPRATSSCPGDLRRHGDAAGERTGQQHPVRHPRLRAAACR